METQKVRDHVTGLPMYEEFLHYVEEELRERWDNTMSYALVSMDINNFKYINRIYGFEKANELLASAVSATLEENPAIRIACRTYSDHILLF